MWSSFYCAALLQMEEAEMAALESLRRCDRQLLLRHWLRPLREVLKKGNFSEVLADEPRHSPLATSLRHAVCIARAYAKAKEDAEREARDMALARLLMLTPANVSLCSTRDPWRLPVTALLITSTRRGHVYLRIAYEREPAASPKIEKNKNKNKKRTCITTMTMRYDKDLKVFIGVDTVLGTCLWLYHQEHHGLATPSPSLRVAAARRMARAWTTYTPATQRCIVKRLLGLSPPPLPV